MPPSQKPIHKSSCGGYEWMDETSRRNPNVQGCTKAKKTWMINRELFGDAQIAEISALQELNKVQNKLHVESVSTVT